MVGIVVSYNATPVFMRVSADTPLVGMLIQVVGMLKKQVGQLALNCKEIVCKSKHALSVGSRAPSKSSRTSPRMHSQKHGAGQAMCVWR
jgi:hypothetical protein